ncbi:vacuolar protein sorting-associated protein 33A [Arctopsyche grandis]|uniref:vacuolar protein sorting-associated protein 33A n=1 Tax=Arctopsyche grandis TaxID=121162 RepID=UPI00406D7EDC
MASHLSGGRLNVALLQEALRKELLNLLQACDGPKSMIWDEWLAGPIGLIAKYGLLQEHDVTEMLRLQKNLTIPSNVKHVIFIIRAKIELIDLIADNVLRVSKSSIEPKKEFHIFFVPRKSELCEKHLSNKRVFGSFTIEEFKCDIYPFESDLISLEFQNDFRDYYLDGDPTCLYQAAVAIKRMENLYGTIPKVIGIGQCAKQVWNLMCRLSKEEQNTAPKGPSKGIIDEILLIDRSTDLATVFSTQLTYEGLIDELFGIKNTTAQFPGMKFLSTDEQNSDASKEKKVVILNSSEEVFAKLRDKNFTYVGSALARKARLMHDYMVENRNNKSIQEIKEFVARLPQMLANKQSLATQTTIAEYIKDITDTIDFHDILQCEEDFLNCMNTSSQNSFIEDLIAQKAPLTQVLRLICLQCVTSSGLKPKVLDYYKRELVHVYGLNTWLGVCNLEKTGILKIQSSTRHYTILRKALRLTVDNSEDSDAKEKSYLDRTYTPITVRLAEILSKNKTSYGLQDIYSLLPGPVIEETQAIPRGQNSVSSDSSSIETTKVVVVFFLGGCTYTEISALRALSQQEESNVDFVIMTTKLINGNTFTESLLEPLPL